MSSELHCDLDTVRVSKVPAELLSSRYQKYCLRFGIFHFHFPNGESDSQSKQKWMQLISLLHSRRALNRRAVEKQFTMPNIAEGGKGKTTWHQKFCLDWNTSKFYRIECVSEIKLAYALTICFLDFSEINFMACTMLSAPPSTATPSCFAPKKSAASKIAAFAMHLATRRQITTPTAICLTSDFSSSILFVRNNKTLEPENVAAVLCLWRCPTWIRKTLPAEVDGKLNYWLQGADSQGTLWTLGSCKIGKRLEL